MINNLSESVALQERMAMTSVLNRRYPKNSLGEVYQSCGVFEKKYHEVKQDLGYECQDDIIGHFEMQWFDIERDQHEN